jgi:tRNA wybutosine-synthesizing protein 3
MLVEPSLASINEIPSYYTTSSCAGRIVLMQIPKIGDKKHALFLGKWHQSVSVDELTNTIPKYKKDQLWLLAQPPIFHIGAEHPEAADTMVQLGVSSGFKHSSIKTMKDQIIVELLSTERADIPLGENGQLFVNEEFLCFCLSIANDVLHRGHKKLMRFEHAMRDVHS